MSKKFLAKLLIFCMVFTMMPFSAFAVDTTATHTDGTYTLQFDTTPVLTELKAGETLNLGANVVYGTGADTVNKWTVTYKPNVETAVTVDEAGLVTAKEVTEDTSVTVTATATATINDVEKTLTLPYEFTVKAAAEDGQAVTVKFAANGGTPAPADIPTKTGEIITLPALTKAGYIFEGWSLTDPASISGGNVAVSMLTGSWTVSAAQGQTEVTLYAWWREEQKPAEEGTFTVEVTNEARQHVLTAGSSLSLKATVKDYQETVQTNARVAWKVVDAQGVELTDGKIITVANGTVTAAKDIKEETEAAVVATYTVTRTVSVLDKDGKPVLDDKGNATTEEKEFSFESEPYTIVVTPITYSIKVEPTSLALVANGEGKVVKATVTATDAEGKAIENGGEGMYISWSVPEADRNKVQLTQSANNTEVTVTGLSKTDKAVVLTASLNGYGKTATCNVTVTIADTKVTFNAGDGTFGKDKDGQDIKTVEKTAVNGVVAEWPVPVAPENKAFVAWQNANGTMVTEAYKHFGLYEDYNTLTAVYEDLAEVVVEPEFVKVNGENKVINSVSVNGAVDAVALKDNKLADEGITLSGNTVVWNLDKKAPAPADGFASTIDQNFVKSIITIAEANAANKDAVVLTLTTNKGGKADITLAMMKVIDKGEVVLSIKPTAVANAVEDIQAAYEVTFTVNGNPVMATPRADGLTQKITLFNPYANSDKKPAAKPFVYYVKGDGTLGERIVNAVYSGNDVVIDALHFSTIAVADRQAFTLTYKNGNTVLEQIEIAFDTKDGKEDKTQSEKVTLRAGSYYGIQNFISWQGNNGTTYKAGDEINLTDDLTLTAYTTSSESTSTGGGGGSSSNVSVATKVTGGKVSITPNRPTKGQTVTITVTPADGYKLDALTVTDLKGNTIELTRVSDSKYTFVMPAGKVKVNPVFVRIDGSDKKDDNQPGGNVSKRFTDIASDAWYAEYVNYVAENGLMNGYEDGRFGPNDKTTRAQIVTVLYRMEGEPAAPASSSFTDVSAGGQYYSSAVTWAARNNIVNGYEDGRFGPNDNVTREQIAAILFRYAEYKGYDTTLTGNVASFSDAAKVSGWANKAIGWAIGEGLMNGDNGALRPQGNATRAEIAALLMRFSENIAK